MNPIEVLELALTKEQSSIDFYESLSQRYTEIKELVSFLLNEEHKHKKMLQDKIEEITRY